MSTKNQIVHVEISQEVVWDIFEKNERTKILQPKTKLFVSLHSDSPKWADLCAWDGNYLVYLTTISRMLFIAWNKSKNN